MPQEQELPKNRPTQVLETYLGTRKAVRTVLSDTQEREDMLDRAANDIADLDKAETETLLRMMLKGLSLDTKTWNNDRRNAMFEMLQLVDIQKVRADHLVDYYTKAVATQDEHVHPLGSIRSLLEAGKFLAPYLPPGAATRETVKDAWDEAAGHFHGTDHAYIIRGKRAIIEEIPLQAEDNIGNPDIKLGWREHPTFERQEQELYEVYLRTTKDQKTFKRAIIEHTLQFQTLCTEYGISLERFWNLSDPDMVQHAFENTAWNENPLMAKTFDRALLTTAGLTLATLDDETSRVIADEIVTAAEKARDELLNGSGDFPNLINRFEQLLTHTKDQSPKAQKAAGSQVAQFLRENGVNLLDTDSATLIHALNDPLTLQVAYNHFAEKKQAKEEAAAMLTDTFGLADRQKDFSLMSRQREDLFLGDLTGDCTAYHLVAGMNAWTVPVWLTNPGFTFYKITDGERLLAKAGILLALADDKPVLLIDSFETGTGIADGKAAEEQIVKGLAFLQSWANRTGISEIKVNLTSNSSGASELLRTVVAEETNPVPTEVLGGLSGVSELRQRVTGAKYQERIYLQSVPHTELWEDEEFEQIQQKQQRVITNFEQILTETMRKADDAERGKIEQLARAEDWRGVFSELMNIDYTLLSNYFGNNWDEYRPLLDQLEVDIGGNVHRVESEVSYHSGFDELPMASKVNEFVAGDMYASYDLIAPDKNGKSVFDDQAYEDLMLEVDRFDELLVLLKEMEDAGLTPESTLHHLYGRTSHDVETDATRIALRSNLPNLTNLQES